MFAPRYPDTFFRISAASKNLPSDTFSVQRNGRIQLHHRIDTIAGWPSRSAGCKLDIRATIDQHKQSQFSFSIDSFRISLIRGKRKSMREFHIQPKHTTTGYSIHQAIDGRGRKICFQATGRMKALILEALGSASEARGARSALQPFAAESLQSAARYLRAVIEMQREPEGAEALEHAIRDAWGNTLRLEAGILSSRGLDGIWDTADDLRADTRPYRDR